MFITKGKVFHQDNRNRFCFQDFLRSIPGSLLCCELHEEWTDVLDEEEEEEEQVQDIKRYTHTPTLRIIMTRKHLHSSSSSLQDDFPLA